MMMQLVGLEPWDEIDFSSSRNRPPRVLLFPSSFASNFCHQPSLYMPGHTDLSRQIARLKVALQRHPLIVGEMQSAWDGLWTAFMPPQHVDHEREGIEAQRTWEAILQTNAVPFVVAALHKTLENASPDDPVMLDAATSGIHCLSYCFFYTSRSFPEEESGRTANLNALVHIMEETAPLLSSWWTIYRASVPSLLAGGSFTEFSLPWCSVAFSTESWLNTKPEGAQPHNPKLR